MVTESDVNEARINMYVRYANLADALTKLAEMVVEDYVESKKVDRETKLMKQQARAVTVEARGGR